MCLKINLDIQPVCIDNNGIQPEKVRKKGRLKNVFKDGGIDLKLLDLDIS